MIYEVGLPDLQPPWLPYFNQLQVIHGEAEVASGVSVTLLPGHTPGLPGVVVETVAGRYLLPSDAVPLYENLGETGGRPDPNGPAY